MARKESKNINLQEAKKAANDEFYTQMKTIEKELSYYRNHFADKVVFCNCDDPESSNFWKYFHINFTDLKLKKLISTHYNKTGEASYKMEYDGGNDPDVSNGNIIVLKGNGDFRSDECIQLLRDSDIVVTNPPFSLFREYIELLMKHKKKFLVLGNQNAITYKEIFPLIKNNELWLGINNGSHEFLVPDNYDKGAIRLGENGQKFVKMGNIAWYTNLDIQKRHTIFFNKESVHPKYYGNEDHYPKYDNYNAINVDKILDIPEDYFECMGVPITFLDKYNPDEFEIIGATESEGKGFSNGLFIISKDNPVKQPLVNGMKRYKRLFISRKNGN